MVLGGWVGNMLGVIEESGAGIWGEEIGFEGIDLVGRAVVMFGEIFWKEEDVVAL